MGGGGEVKGVRVMLGTDVASLTGRITTAAATAAESGQQQQAAGPCVVLLVPIDPMLSKRRWSHLSLEVSAEGKFGMKGAPGEYLVMLWNPKLANNLTQYVKEHREGARRVTLRAKEETKLELSRGCEQEGELKK